VDELNNQGGPNHVGNYCYAPLYVKHKKVCFETSYYYIGHFSQFIKRGAKRTAFSKYSDAVECTVLENPGGSFIVVAMNRGVEKLAF
jgi:glucosylceramidase